MKKKEEAPTFINTNEVVYQSAMDKIGKAFKCMIAGSKRLADISLLSQIMY